MTDPKEPEAPKLLTPDECYKLVHDVSQELITRVYASVEHVPGKQRWLLCGRIVNRIFIQFFRVTTVAASQTLDEEAHKQNVLR